MFEHATVPAHTHETHRLSREMINARCLALYVFQYGLLAPIMSVVNGTAVVAISSAGILFFVLFYNRQKLFINAKILLFIACFGFLIFLKKIFQPESSMRALVDFMLIVVPSLYIAGLNFDREYYFEVCKKLAIINFFINVLWPVVGVGDEYMRFGYAMLLTPVYLYCHYRINQISNAQSMSKSLWILMSVSLIEMLVFGSRGCLLCMMLVLLSDWLFIRRISIKKIILMIFTAAFIAALPNIVNAVVQLFREHGFYSYSLTQLRIVLNQGLRGSSREIVYEYAISIINENLLFGAPLYQKIGSMDYAHNIFLQLGVDFGVAAIGVFFLFLCKVCYLLSRKTVGFVDKFYIISIMSISLGRLMFSSTYWKRPEFWLFLGFILAKGNSIINNGKGLKSVGNAYE